MIEKQPLFAHRVRKVPKQFSWLDHRLVRDRHIEHCSHPAAARQNLIHIGLIAYIKPLYQVLALDPEPVIATGTARSSLDQPLSLAQIFKRMAGDIS